MPLRFSEKNALIYIYRPVKLKQDLAHSEAEQLLKILGYCCEKPESCIVHLIKRLRENGDFPHEIGLFLGYPPEDVKGFIEKREHEHKFTGCWKVYGDAEKAQKLFAKYKKCTEVYTKQLAGGNTLEKLSVAF